MQECLHCQHDVVEWPAFHFGLHVESNNLPAGAKNNAIFLPALPPPPPKSHKAACTSQPKQSGQPACNFHESIRQVNRTNKYDSVLRPIVFCFGNNIAILSASKSAISGYLLNCRCYPVSITCNHVPSSAAFSHAPCANTTTETHPILPAHAFLKQHDNSIPRAATSFQNGACLNASSRSQAPVILISAVALRTFL